MKYRIAMWASAVFLVAGGWALYALGTFPLTNERMREAWTLISVTCPIAIAGMHFPSVCIGLWLRMPPPTPWSV